MHDLLKTSSRVLLVPGLLTLALAPGSVLGDDTGFLGRIFRLGGNSSASPPGGSGRAAASSDRSATLPYGPTGASAGPVSQPAANPRPSGPGSSGAPFADGPSTPDVPGDLSSQPRVSPRPRTSSAVTSADPLLTRMALGRSNDGSQFGMFLQIFADGTVIDSDGVHKLGAADLRPIAELIQGGELTPRPRPLQLAVGRLRGVRPGRGLREADGEVAGPLALVLGESPGLRSRHPPAPHFPGVGPGEAEPPNDGGCLRHRHASRRRCTRAGLIDRPVGSRVDVTHREARFDCRPRSGSRHPGDSAASRPRCDELEPPDHPAQPSGASLTVGDLDPRFHLSPEGRVPDSLRSRKSA